MARLIGPNSRRGHAALEFAFVAPWLLFLFAGAFDVGFYAYGVISAQNAARVAALYTSSSGATAADAAGACQCALAEMKSLANANSLTNCQSLPLIVTARAFQDATDSPASEVTVTYQSAQLVPLPWLTGRLTVVRSVQMRVKP